MDEQKLDVTAQQPDAALHAQTEEITNEALPEALLEQQAAQAELSQAIEASAEELQPEQAEQTTQPERVTVVDIRFRNNAKTYFFDPGELRPVSGDHVIIETARGDEYGICAGACHEVKASEIVPPLRKVLRMATAQDERIAGLAHNAGKASVIVVNKWDSIEKDNDSVRKFEKDVYTALSYMTYAPLLFISAKTGQRVDKLFPLINAVYEQAGRRVTTGMLNDVLAGATARVQPPSDKGRRLKIYYMTQTGANPPCFVVFVNNAGLFHFSYQRYIENCIRDAFGFAGTPIKLVIRQKGENAENL